MAHHQKAHRLIGKAGGAALLALTLAACSAPGGSTGSSGSSAAPAAAVATQVAGPAGTAVSSADAQRLLGQLDTIGEDYAKAVSGASFDVAEYREARDAFLSFQKSYLPISGVVQAASPDAAREIDSEIGELKKWFADEEPAAAPASAQDVQDAVGEIRAELSSALGLKAAPTGTPQTAEAKIGSIKATVDRSVADYKAGKKDSAYELAADAYLEGYEQIEADLAAKGQQSLMTDVEGRFTQLRDAIKAGKPVSEVEAIAQRVQQGLDQSLEALR